MAQPQPMKTAKSKPDERVCVTVKDDKIVHLSPKTGDSIVVRGEVTGYSVGDRYSEEGMGTLTLRFTSMAKDDDPKPVKKKRTAYDMQDEAREKMKDKSGVDDK